MLLKNLGEVKEGFSNLVVELYQIQISLSNRASLIRQQEEHNVFSFAQTRKVKPGIVTIKLNELERVINTIEHCLDKLNEIGDIYFKDGLRYSDCLSKQSGDSRRELTKFFDDMAFKSDTEEELSQRHIVILGGIGFFIVILLFIAFLIPKTV